MKEYKWTHDMEYIQVADITTWDALPWIKSKRFLYQWLRITDFYIDFHDNKYNCNIRPFFYKSQMQNCHDVSLLALIGNQTWFGHLWQSLV